MMYESTGTAGVHECPHEILQEILEALIPNYSTLYSCTLVNRQFNRAASKVLYTRIVYSPRSDERTLSLRDRGKLSVYLSTMPRCLLSLRKCCRNHLLLCRPCYLTTPSMFNGLRSAVRLVASSWYTSLRIPMFRRYTYAPPSIQSTAGEVTNCNPCVSKLTDSCLHPSFTLP